KRFCDKYPHLVRRLRDRLNCKRPSDVIDFLRENRTVPTRYKNATDLAEAERQFPSLPPRFSETEAHPASETRDEFTGFKAARAWFAYANVLVPPPDRDPEGRPLPGPTPRPGEEGRFGEYDPMKYRVPRLPMLSILRQAESRMSVPPNVTDPENDPAVMRVVRARVAMQFYDQNRTVTNFPYFLAAAEAEEKPDTVVARKILWQADQARKSVRGRLEAVK